MTPTIEDECPEETICHIKGPYQGKRLMDIPSKYLYWVAENCYNDELATAADKVWVWREKNGEHWEEGDRL